MLEDDDEMLPPRAEEIPERLARKWAKRERREGVMNCPACKKQILAVSTFCVYCGEPVAMRNRRRMVWATLFIFLILGLYYFTK